MCTLGNYQSRQLGNCDSSGEDRAVPGLQRCPKPLQQLFCLWPSKRYPLLPFMVVIILVCALFKLGKQNNSLVFLCVYILWSILVRFIQVAGSNYIFVFINTYVPCVPSVAHIHTSIMQLVKTLVVSILKILQVQ